MDMKKQFKSKYPLNLELTDDNGRPLNYCGIRCSMEVLGGKWKLLIVASLAKGSLRFSELKKDIPEISEKMLIRSLQDLEYHKIVDRLVYEQVPPKVEYSLSAYGQSVIPLLQVLFQWGETHIEKHSDLIFQ
jgi:DNA-binding HxlR family transcriptional regulator